MLLRAASSGGSVGGSVGGNAGGAARDLYGRRADPAPYKRGPLRRRAGTSPTAFRCMLLRGFRRVCGYRCMSVWLIPDLHNAVQDMLIPDLRYTVRRRRICGTAYADSGLGVCGTAGGARRLLLPRRALCRG
eukprot:1840788-Rhodomonas_salina.1